MKALAETIKMAVGQCRHARRAPALLSPGRDICLVCGEYVQEYPQAEGGASGTGGGS